jgi:hypothetical protein
MLEIEIAPLGSGSGYPAARYPSMCEMSASRALCAASPVEAPAAKKSGNSATFALDHLIRTLENT